MSTNYFTNIHVRDFINQVARDPTRPGYDSALQLHSDVHIPSVQGEELSDDFDCKNIPTIIRFFAPAGQVDQFKTNAFVYTTGSFNINSQDGFPELLVNAFSANW
jgi:hypothetical protein